MVFNSGLVFVGHTDVDGLCKAHCNGKSFLLISVYSFSFLPVLLVCWLGVFFVMLLFFVHFGFSF